MEITAGEFKARCLRLMDEVRDTGREVVITKRGKPVARLVPVCDDVESSVFGCMKGTVEIVGDIIAPLEEEWEAMR
ncbi:MAG: type II toxin-antitoxin system prevent-host-death family antitoxin [Pseudomonadota bacterium]